MLDKSDRSSLAGVMGAAFVCVLTIAIASNVATADALRFNAPTVQSYKRAVDDLAAPAMEGRGPGTEGIERARDYLVDHFKMLGLEPTFDESYTQPFEIPLGSIAKTQTLKIAGADGVAEELAAGKHFNALGLSSNDKFRADVVFAGYGVKNEKEEYDSYAGSEKLVDGKAVIVFRYEPLDDEGQSLWSDRPGRFSASAAFAAKAKLAATHGAAALIVVDPPGRPLKGRLHDARSLRAGSKGPGIPVYHITIDTLKSIIRAAGMKPDKTIQSWQQQANAGTLKPLPIEGVKLGGQVELEKTRTTVHNVAGILPGKGKLKDQTIIIGGHYDHLGFGSSSSIGRTVEIHNGADDNASGTAGVMMLAQQFAYERLTGKSPEDQRTLLFVCFSAEERGLLGSSYMASNLDQLNVDAEKIAAMINMDMIGRAKDNKATVFGLGNCEHWETLVNDANADIQFELNTTKQAPRNSDHASFLRKKIPAIHVFGGFHTDYHKPTDTSDKINFADAVRMLDLITHIVVQMDARFDAFEFVGSDKPADPHAGVKDLPAPSANQPRLGIMPDYAIEGGCGVSDVFQNTPAAKAGLKTGDLIVQWNEKEIQSVRDLTDALRDSKIGEKVKLKVKRKERVLDFDVTIEAR